MARRAMRNRPFIGYTLGPLERNVRGRLFDSEEGGGGRLSNFIWTDNIFSAWAQPRNLFSCGMGSGKIYFRVNMVKHSPQLKAITRNSNVIEMKYYKVELLR